MPALSTGLAFGTDGAYRTLQFTAHGSLSQHPADPGIAAPQSDFRSHSEPTCVLSTCNRVETCDLGGVSFFSIKLFLLEMKVKSTRSPLPTPGGLH